MRELLVYDVPLAIAVAIALWIVAGLVWSGVLAFAPIRAPSSPRFGLYNRGVRVLMLAILAGLMLYAAALATYWFGDCQHGLKAPATCTGVPDLLGQFAFGMVFDLPIVGMLIGLPAAVLGGIFETVTTLRWRGQSRVGAAPC